MNPLRRVLIIDDEPAARDDLRTRLAAHPVAVVGEAGRIDDARRALASVDYDVVFLDVELRGGSGFDLVPQVRPPATIVFVTAFERYAVRAFEINALDYLVKPVSAERLAATLRRLEAPAGVDAPPAAAPRFDLDDQLYLKANTDQARFVRVREIVAILSEENYTDVRLTDGTHVLVRRTMRAWEELLPAPHFARVHRTAILAWPHVRAATHVSRDVTQLDVRGLPGPVQARRELWLAWQARGGAAEPHR